MASIIEEISTITAKGQTTVPKAVRQTLGVDYSGKNRPIASKRVGSRVHNPEAEHHDPTLAAFLGLIEKGIAADRNVRDRSGTGSFQRCRSGLRDVYTRIDILGAGNIFKPSEVT
jgi:hypothetical protein